MTISRRSFIEAGATAAAGLALPGIPTKPFARPGSRPIVIASANGIRGVAKAYDMLTSGADPLDAAIQGVVIQELDPEDQSVGLGGLPNEDGVVQLDASVMHGPTKRAGAVGALEDIATPSLVAKAVMDYTDHILLVGAGAKKFALEMGFKEQNLLTEKSRQDWLRWKAHQDTNWTHGTINMCAVNAAGDMGSVTTTSGISYKIAGRVGDSPIIGAGQYCDNTVGAAGSTGYGEANIKACGAFYAVELMRQGLDPEAACLKVIERVIAMTEKRLLDDRGRAKFDLTYYAVTKDGRYGSACLYEGTKFAVADTKGARIEECAYALKASERPKGA
jgi:N4-(beta-N-acetylglucosaminyl)-L-asparaginase